MGYDMIMAGVAITIDVPCPIPEMCPPPMCGPGQMRCFAEPSVDGCNPIASCEPASKFSREVIIKNTRITNTEDFYHKEHRKFEFSIANTRFS